MKLKILSLIAMFTISGLAAAASGTGGPGMHAHGVQQPMPSLMRVIKRHADQLNLSDEQNTQLAAWHDQNHRVVHGKLAEIQAIEKEMQQAVIDGANRAQINGYIARMDALRDQIVSTKLACRNNMRAILDDGQWQTLARLYRENLM